MFALVYNKPKYISPSSAVIQLTKLIDIELRGDADSSLMACDIVDLTLAQYRRLYLAVDVLNE